MKGQPLILESEFPIIQKTLIKYYVNPGFFLGFFYRMNISAKRDTIGVETTQRY